MIVRLSHVDPMVSQVVNLAELDWLDPDEPGSWPGTEYDLPDALAKQFIDADRVFWAAQRALSNFFRAVERDRTAYKHQADIERRRLQRGRARQYRRARPSNLAEEV